MRSLVVLFLASILPGFAHDSWVQVYSSRVTSGQPAYVDLMLGNHGNEHRDFKIASKIPLEGSTFMLRTPGGQTSDLGPSLIDMGSSPKEGFWSSRFIPETRGMYCIAHTYEAIVTYAPKRAIKSAKAYFAVGDDSDPAQTDFTTPIGHPFEIVPLQDPTKLVAGKPFEVVIFFKGEPLKDVVVSCIPRGKVLAKGFDPAHETRTDNKGHATLALPEANLYLIAAHQKAPQETGEGYSAGTEYGATLTVIAAVP